MAPRDELLSFALPLPWRGLMLRALVRGVLCGLLLALTFLPVGLLLELTRGTMRAEPVIAFAVFAGVVGLLGGGAGAAVEAWARRRSGRTLLAAITCGALVSGACLIVVAHALYLSGAVLGGPEAGMGRVSRLLSVAAGKPNQVIGGTLGALAALGAPFGVTVALRLRGFRLPAQAGLGVVASGGAGVALIVGFAIAGAIAGGDFDRLVAIAVLGALAALGGFAGFGLLFVGAPLAALTPFALALADAVNERFAPTPPPPPTPCAP